jgi:hypothetical protein
MIASGAVLAGGGAGFLVLSHRRQDQVDGAPVHDVDDFEHLRDLEDEGERYQKIGAGLLVAGGAVAAGGVVLALVRRASGGEREAASSGGEGVSVGAAPLTGGFGVTVSWRSW